MKIIIKALFILLMVFIFVSYIYQNNIENFSEEENISNKNKKECVCDNTPTISNLNTQYLILSNKLNKLDKSVDLRIAKINKKVNHNTNVLDEIEEETEKAKANLNKSFDNSNFDLKKKNIKKKF